MNTTDLVVQVQFGDCGPDACVLLQNVTRWMDAASQHYFSEHGVPPWGRIEQPPGPLCARTVDVHMHLDASIAHPDVLRFRTRVEEWHETEFVQSHRIMRGDALVGELRETRALFHPDAEGRLQRLPIPRWIRSRCD